MQSLSGSDLCLCHVLYHVVTSLAFYMLSCTSMISCQNVTFCCVEGIRGDHVTLQVVKLIRMSPLMLFRWVHCSCSPFLELNAETGLVDAGGGSGGSSLEPTLLLLLN